MNSHRTSRYLKIALLPLSLATILTFLSHPAMGAQNTRPVPKPVCEPQDRTESVQGQTTLAERFAPGPAKAYNCNLELVGQFEGEGAGADVEIFENCAYYSTAALVPNLKMKHPGVAVLDVSDARHPKATAYLDSPAMLGAHESLEIDKTRKLLLGSALPATFDVYDLSTDCRRPVLIRSQTVPGLVSHGGQFTADGLTFYGGKWPPDAKNPPAAAVFALDASDPANLRSLATWVPPDKDWITHGAVVSKDATRVYVALKRMAADHEKAPNPNGLVIFDVSDIQARRPNAQFRLISTLFWDDTRGSEGMQVVMIRGRPYLIFSDNLGAIGYESPPPADACEAGKPGHGYARIIDLSDEKNPKTVSRLMPEAADPANCSKVMHDPTLYGGYGSFGCTIDNDADGKLLACGNFEGGLRVFDIRDPLRPREVAYYKPPARRTETRPGSIFLISPTGPQTGPARDHTADSVVVAPKFHKNGEEIWFTSADNGFQVVRFTDHFKASHKELFRN